MANICDNTFYASSDDRQNLEAIIKFFEENEFYVDIQDEGDYLDAYFDSKWVFPEELMEELYQSIPNKDDIYMRCLSVEYGLMYHALWYCDEDGWHES